MIEWRRRNLTCTWAVDLLDGIVLEVHGKSVLGGIEQLGHVRHGWIDSQDCCLCISVDVVIESLHACACNLATSL